MSKYRNLHAEIMSNPLMFLARNVVTGIDLGPKQAGPATFYLKEFASKKDLSFVTLTVSGSGTALTGYWVPQGGHCVIPENPGTNGIVFTPDFSGCSIKVDKLRSGEFKVYHVQGGSNYAQTEYLSKDHGQGQVASMDFDDYGARLEPRCFAFLHYDANDGWCIYSQRHTGMGFRKTGGKIYGYENMSRANGKKIAFKQPVAI